MRLIHVPLPLLACASMLLVGCGPKRIDASSDESLKNSIESVKAPLSDEKKSEFESAVKTIAFKDVKSLMDLTDPQSLIRQGKDRLNGKTAEEVIAEGNAILAEKKQAQRQQIQGEIKELSDKQSAAASAGEKLKAIAVNRSRFSFQDNGFSRDPVIELTVKNGTASALSHIFFHGVLATPGRSVPWVSEDFNYEVPGGIESGESATWTLSPNQFGPWGSAPKDRKDMVLTVTVTRCDGPDGKTLYNAEFSKEDADRLDSLKKQLAPI